MRATGVFALFLASVGVMVARLPSAVNGFPAGFVHGFRTGAYGRGAPRPIPYGHYLRGPTGATGMPDR